MPHSRRKQSTSLVFTVLFIVVLCIFPAIALASAGASSPSQPAVEPEDELICHTDDPSECYYRIFRATDEFQTVKEDQDLPKGLHVRLDVTTGKKEAKFIVDGEMPAGLEGQATDQSVLVVDQPEGQDERPLKVPKNAPQYENVGKVKEPQATEQHTDAVYFPESLQMLKKGSDGSEEDDRKLDEALELLKDISHDIYYGLKITEDVPALSSLFCLMSGAKNSGESKTNATPPGQQAASILAGALSNNPTALKEVSKEWDNIMGSVCPKDTKPLRETAFRFVDPDPETWRPTESLAAKAKAKAGAFNGLIKDDHIRADFLRSGGMKELLEVLAQGGKQWAAAQRKAGQLALDNFLDEDMGAVLGQWPRTEKLSNEECAVEEFKRDEGCWDYQVESIMKANKGDKTHWSRDLQAKLKGVRKSGAVPKHAEL